MAAVSAWAKPGAWALESEQQEESAAATSALDKGYSSSDSHQSSSDFPSLSAAAVTKIPKKKKKQTLTLAEFNAGTTKFQPSYKTLVPVELLSLPTGPRERSEEELQRPRGFGYFNGGGGRGGSSRVSDENPERGAHREPREFTPSRADEVDDWGSMKKSAASFERRDSDRERGRGFFDSQSRADESDSWISKKGTAPPVSSERREMRGFDLFNREGMNGNRVDSDSWGKNREDNGGSGRPRLVLQPRTLPVVNGCNGEEKKEIESKREERKEIDTKIKGANPFGEARPREEVLKEKGKDWKEIDEKLEAVKLREGGNPAGRKGFEVGNGLKEDRTERAWRTPEASDETPPTRVESVEEQLPEN